MGQDVKEPKKSAKKSAKNSAKSDTKQAKAVNGKGDKCRVKDWDKFRTNWTKIFKKKRKK